MTRQRGDFRLAPAIISSIKYSRGLNKTSTIFCNYWFDSEIIVNGLARSKGNNVLVDVGSGRSELVMTALVIVSIAAAIWVSCCTVDDERKQFWDEGSPISELALCSCALDEWPQKVL